MTSSYKLVQEFVAEPSLSGLRAWQKRMGFTYETAAAALGMGRSGYGSIVQGDSPIDRRTTLACLAIEMGLSPFTSNIPAPPKKVGRKPKIKCQDPLIETPSCEELEKRGQQRLVD